MKFIPNDIIQQVVELTDAQSLFGRYTNLERKGNRLRGISPFNKAEKTPSFFVDPERKLYYCFSTNKSGNLFQFIQEVENLNFPEAVKLLAKEVGISIPDNTSYSPEDIKKQESTQKIRDVLGRITLTFEHFFWTENSGSQARSYMQERKFTETTLKKFRIGYSPEGKNWLYNFLSKKGYTSELLSELGLFSKNYPTLSLFSNRIMFPIIDSSNTVVGFGGRIINGDGPKYINSPQTHLYHKKKKLYGLVQNLEGIKKLKKVFLVEGYLDVMALHQAGVEAAVAPLGTAFTDEQASILQRVTNQVVMIFDNDTAGWNAAVKSAVICERVGIADIKIIILKENDPGDILQNQGEQALREAILGESRQEFEWFEYYLQKMTPSFDASYQERETLTQEIVKYLVEVNSKYKYSSYIHKASEVLDITPEVLENFIKKASQNMHTTNSFRNTNSNTDNDESFSDVPIPKPVPIAMSPEFLAMAAICDNPDIFNSIRIKFKNTDLQDDNAREIFMVLETAFRNNALNTNEILQLLPENIKSHVIRLITTAETQVRDKNKFIKDLQYHLKLNRLQKLSTQVEIEIRKLQAQLHSEFKNENKGKFNKKMDDLLLEKDYYIKEITQHKKDHKNNKN